MAYEAKLLLNKLGGMTNETGVQWLEWLLSDGGASVTAHEQLQAVTAHNHDKLETGRKSLDSSL
jgi:hypothetical protein